MQYGSPLPSAQGMKTACNVHHRRVAFHVTVELEDLCRGHSLNYIMKAHAGDNVDLTRSVDSISAMPGPCRRIPQGAAEGGNARSPGTKRSRDPSIRGFIKETSRDAGYRKAAQFLMLLGKDEAARVLRHMSAEEVEGITREIARTQHIEEKEASKVLEEFGFIRETKDLIAQGGIEKAQEMLIASVGPRRRRRSSRGCGRTSPRRPSPSCRTSTPTRPSPW